MIQTIISKFYDFYSFSVILTKNRVVSGIPEQIQTSVFRVWIDQGGGVFFNRF